MSGDALSQSTLDIKQHFVTREGYYKNLPAYEYSRPNRPSGIHAFSGNQPPNLPVKISLVHVPDDDTGYADRILFNVGREIFLYAFKSIWEVRESMKKSSYRVGVISHPSKSAHYSRIAIDQSSIFGDVMGVYLSKPVLSCVPYLTLPTFVTFCG